jgi:signal transduction histidine kinase
VVDVEIDDDGRGAAAPLGASAEGGHGLIGMRERVTTSGGAFSAGPRPGGGWRVRAAFPLDGGPAEPARRPLPTGTGARP